jgi:hypothetical protein
MRKDVSQNYNENYYDAFYSHYFFFLDFTHFFIC